MAFTEEQIKAIEWFQGPMMVLGTPGSGKTTVIVNRINNLIYEHDVSPESILVITFTRVFFKSKILKIAFIWSGSMLSKKKILG